MSKKTIFLPVAYFAVVSIFLIWHGKFFSPDQFFAAAILITLFLGRSKAFIKDWSVPVVLLLSYDYLRGLVPSLTQGVNIYPMINFDKAVFGSLPTNSLQSVFYTNGTVNWYDYLGAGLYMSHFIAPMLFGFIFWLKDRDTFQKYFLSLLLLSYAAFFTYILFPAMPPWMASLHAAYPLLTFFFLVKKFKALGFLILPYILGIWFSIVYFGEHYVFDIVAGALYAVAAFCLVLYFQKIIKIFTYAKIRR